MTDEQAVTMDDFLRALSAAGLAPSDVVSYEATARNGNRFTVSGEAFGLAPSPDYTAWEQRLVSALERVATSVGADVNTLSPETLADRIIARLDASGDSGGNAQAIELNPCVDSLPRVVRVLAWLSTTGEGVKGAPIRRVYHLGTLDGRHLASYDTWRPDDAEPANFATQNLMQPESLRRGENL